MAIVFPDILFPLDNKVYSDSTINWNINPRKVKCPLCLIEIVTELAGPKCGVCNSSMITIVDRSSSELARRISQST